MTEEPTRWTAPAGPVTGADVVALLGGPPGVDGLTLCHARAVARHRAR